MTDELDTSDKKADKPVEWYVGLLRPAKGWTQVMVSDTRELILLAATREFSLIGCPEKLDIDVSSLFTDAARRAFTAHLGYSVAPKECAQRIQDFMTALLQSGVDLASRRSTAISNYVCVLAEKPYVCLRQHAPDGAERIDVPSAMPMVFSLQPLMDLPDEDRAIARTLGLLFLRGIGLVQETVHAAQLVGA
ncbi:MAG TPA: hypothetical protein VHA78_04590 [Candidatus Peribacteraceae bacterium]|nr:hypothetical protein [Candidatus Peribacteraceae bacterium]